MIFVYVLAKKQDERNREMPRYEKIFRRIDKDRDGMLTPKEFKMALKQLHYKDVEQWSLRMVQRLFDECDRNKDGMLSIQEFVTFVLDRQEVVKLTKGVAGDKGKEERAG
ncbi:EF-hand domain-containing protein [archaeon]|nr:MAG: EF-hand domain-containing protein [archaeon]